MKPETDRGLEKNSSEIVHDPRAKTAFRGFDFAKKGTSRGHYLSEKARIINEIGSLEQIRVKLGLSQRRMCQLLLVDPSAWTRWNKTDAPPHIYQALSWLMELVKVNPEAATPSAVTHQLDYLSSTTQSKIKEIENSIATLERIIAATPAQQSQTLAPDDQSLNRALQSLETQFQLKLALLEANISQLSAANARRGHVKAKRTRNMAKRARVNAKSTQRARIKAKSTQHARMKLKTKPMRKGVASSNKIRKAKMKVNIKTRSKVKAKFNLKKNLDKNKTNRVKSKIKRAHK